MSRRGARDGGSPHGDDGRIVAAGGGRRDQFDADSIRDAAAGVARLGFGGTLAWLLDSSLPLDHGGSRRARSSTGIVLGGYDPGGRGRRRARAGQSPSSG